LGSLYGLKTLFLKTIVFATHNPGKLREVQSMLPEGILVKSLEDIGCHKPIAETGSTLKANARIKASYVRKTYGYDCFADDTGLEVAALDGAPGVYSARYAGPAGDSKANIAKLLAAMEGKQNRNARFRTVIALVLDGQMQFFEGVVNGVILSEPDGDGGFGYDPIFMPEGGNRSFARYGLAEKNAISHRGKAFRKLQAFLLESL
jgi:XTP/dITP diphosphohydrolase